MIVNYFHGKIFTLYDQTIRYKKWHRNGTSCLCLLSSLCLPSDISIDDVMCISVLSYRAPSIVLISNSLSCTDLARPGIRAVTNGEMLTFELCILHPITRPDGQNNNITQCKHAIKVVVIKLCLLFRDYHFHSNSRGTLATSCSRPICHLFSLWCCPGCHSGSTTKPPVPGWL